MTDDEGDFTEVYLLHPFSLTDEDIKTIENMAMKEFKRSTKSLTRCVLVAYVEWLSVETIKVTSH